MSKRTNTCHWDALYKTDPKHTKPFSRAGGFKGTAMKPIWIIQRLTEHFGPVGEGWGMGEPSFQVVDLTADTGKIMVYCTVPCWHTNRENVFYGVGGDTVQDKFNSGKFAADDEAFKKAFTDAVNNAFKFVGVGGDVHMGQFDDSKYVAEMREEFAPEAEYIGQLAKMREDIATATSKLELDEVLVTYAAPIAEAEAAKDPLVKTTQSEWVKRMKLINEQISENA